MGRQARIKRERRRAAAASPVDEIPDTGLVIVTGPPFPGCEDAVADDGYFDDCPICQALRGGDSERALELMRESPGYVDLRDPEDRN